MTPNVVLWGKLITLYDITASIIRYFVAKYSILEVDISFSSEREDTLASFRSWSLPLVFVNFSKVLWETQQYCFISAYCRLQQETIQLKVRGSIMTLKSLQLKLSRRKCKQNSNYVNRYRYILIFVDIGCLISGQGFGMTTHRFQGSVITHQCQTFKQWFSSTAEFG